MVIFCDRRLRFLFLFFFFIYEEKLCASNNNANNNGDPNADAKAKDEGMIAKSIAGFIDKADPKYVMKAYIGANLIPATTKIVLFLLDKVFVYTTSHELSALQEEENARLLEEMRRVYMHSVMFNLTKNLEVLKNGYEEIIGQNEVKRDAENQVSTRLLSAIAHEKSWVPGDKNGPGVCYICLVGLPGLGKSDLSICLAKAMCLGQQSKRVFTIDASTLLNSLGGRRGISSLCSHVEKKKDGKSYFVNSEFFSYVKAVRYPVVVFNEVDKILAEPDLRKDLSEFLRSIKEEGYIVSDTGERVDCSGLTIIFTSNNAKMFSDPSMDTRFNMIYFQPFSEEEYFELFSKKLGKFLDEVETVQFFAEDIIVSENADNSLTSSDESATSTSADNISLNNEVNRSTNSDESTTSTRAEEKQKKISFKISCEGCRKIAKEAHSDPSLSSMGARCADHFKNKLSGFLTKEMVKKAKKKENVEVENIRNNKEKEGKGIVEGENIIGYKDGEFFFI